MNRWWMAVLLAVSSALAACNRASRASEAPGALPPANEVWLTTEQVREAKISVETADEQNVDDTVLASGKVAFDDLRVSHIYSPVNGRVTRIDAQPGQRVKKGADLAVIESPDIGLASADLGKAQADLIAAEHDFKREKELAEAHAASQKDVEQSEDAYMKAKAEMERAKQKAFLFRAGTGASVTQGYVLRAGIDGEVIGRNVSPGMEVQGQYGGGQAIELFTIGELDKIWVIADIFEMDLARIHVGDHAIVKVVAYKGKTFEGRVDWVSGTLDPNTRTARVRCTFDNADRLLKPEMYATIQISVEERKALAIPHSAMLRLGEQTVVFTETGRTADGKTKFERVPVSVDEGEGSKWVPVVHGLEPGMRVVTNGAILLSGML